MPMIGRIVTGSFYFIVWEYVSFGEVGEVGRDAFREEGYTVYFMVEDGRFWMLLNFWALSSNI